MGTNYYVAKNLCDCCRRHDTEYHIGKSSSGWAFSFQGYRAAQLISWRAWKAFLKDKNIVDEYGDTIDYEWFVNLVETYKAPHYVDAGGRQNLQHNTQGKINARPWFNPEYEWDDEDGYAFCSKEFS